MCDIIEMRGKNMFNELKKEIENCKFCEEKFGFAPHPIFWESKIQK